MKTQNDTIVIKNRKARHDYFILNSIEAGIVLTGTEVKSLRNGRANLRDSYASVINNEVFVHNVHINVYEHGSVFNHDPERQKKLLLHRSEIKKLKRLVREKGITLIPLKIYFRKGLAKIELGIVKGKRQFDKRKRIAEKDAGRQLQSDMV